MARSCSSLAQESGHSVASSSAACLSLTEMLLPVLDIMRFNCQRKCPVSHNATHVGNEWLTTGADDMSNVERFAIQECTTNRVMSTIHKFDLCHVHAELCVACGRET